MKKINLYFFSRVIGYDEWCVCDFDNIIVLNGYDYECFYFKVFFVFIFFFWKRFIGKKDKIVFV